MTNRYLQFTVLGGTVLSASAFAVGGWAAVTVDDVPEYLVAGRPVTVSFVVRQHGVTPLSSLSPTVSMTGPAQLSVAAKPTGKTGQYTATVTPSRAGDWTITVNSGFGPSKTTMMPIKAIDVGAATPKPLADADRGLHLFVAKSCGTCHVRGSLGKDGFKQGPDLTGRRYSADVVAKFLADPEKSPLAGPAKEGQLRMPNLGLREREITALVAFLNSELRISSREP